MRPRVAQWEPAHRVLPAARRRAFTARRPICRGRRRWTRSLWPGVVATRWGAASQLGWSKRRLSDRPRRSLPPPPVPQAWAQWQASGGTLTEDLEMQTFEAAAAAAAAILTGAVALAAAAVSAAASAVAVVMVAAIAMVASAKAAIGAAAAMSATAGEAQAATRIEGTRCRAEDEGAAYWLAAGVAAARPVVGVAPAHRVAALVVVEAQRRPLPRLVGQRPGRRK